MAAAGRPVTQAAAQPRGHAWDGGERGWDGYFAVVLVGGLIMTQVAESAPESSRLTAAAALLAMVAWFLLLGRRAIYGADVPGWVSLTYLAGLVPLLAVAEYNMSVTAFMLAALCPHCFMATSSRRAIAFVVALSLPQVVIAFAKDAPANDLAIVSAIAVLSIAFSVAFGTWIMRIIDQSAERADLITQLERTRAELAAANREAGMLAERARLASEIHDTIAQGFTSIVMLAQAAESVIGSDPDLARKQLGLIASTGRQNLAEARAVVAGLTPVPLASGTLADALARLTEQTGLELGLAASFSMDGAPRSLGTGTEVVLLRVCQEALSNVRKHACAQGARVLLSYGERCVCLEVADDGLGFDAAQVREGYGLRGMRARVAEIGGRLAVRSAPGAGTTVSAEVA
jgi:signal transduction histidine kinase